MRMIFELENFSSTFNEIFFGWKELLTDIGVKIRINKIMANQEQ